MKSIFGLLLLLVGGFVLVKVLPAYWDDYKLGRMLEDQALSYTYTSKSDEDIATAIAEKAQSVNVQLSPEQVKVARNGGSLSITAEYTVHVDFIVYPADLKFTTGTTNKDVMK